ncbi:MAG TPA: hypothetical protein VK906_09685 [Egicoccus sp.]|nr:hypothetical protein [Egicoccus sp.]HSK23436.1 hypothetical protein [Egicoccus sp.]
MASAIGLVAVLGVGISALAVTNGDGLVVTQPPTLTLAGDDPFPWVVAVSSIDDGRWCATTVRGSGDLPDPVGQPCGQLITEPEPDDFSWHGTDPAVWSIRTPGQGLSWGLVGPAVDTSVTVVFADGSSGRALLDSGGPGEVTLWAIAYEGTAIQQIEASGDRASTGTVVLEGFDPFDALVVVGFLAVATAAVVALVRSRRLRPDQ